MPVRLASESWSFVPAGSVAAMITPPRSEKSGDSQEVILPG
jgi:hypothetical protein